MSNWLERAELLVGTSNQKAISKLNVLVVGLGGVGSYAAEFLGRAGVGKMTIVDGDEVDPTNKNRQLHAMDSTVGKRKAQLMADRLLDINPALDLTVIDEFIMPDRPEALVKGGYDYVLDCIDSITPKVKLITACKENKVRIYSSMGAGGKLDPSRVQVTDISKTKNCKFAARLRKNLKKHKIRYAVKVVYSDELQIEDSLQMTDGSNFKRSFYGTVSYMPALFGLRLAAEVLRSAMRENEAVQFELDKS